MNAFSCEVQLATLATSRASQGSIAVASDLRARPKSQQPEKNTPVEKAAPHSAVLPVPPVRVMVGCGAADPRYPTASRLRLTVKRRELGSERKLRGVFYEARPLRGQQRPIHVAIRPPRLRGSVTLIARPHESLCQVIPGPASEHVRVREQQIAHGGTLRRTNGGGELLHDGASALSGFIHERAGFGRTLDSAVVGAEGGAT